MVVTFDPHPLKVLRPDAIRLISTTEQKIELIEKAGIDVLVVIPFDREFAATTAGTFVEEILIGTIGVRELVVGYDYAFGRGRQGNIEFLQEKGREHGFRSPWWRPISKTGYWSAVPGFGNWSLRGGWMTCACCWAATTRSGVRCSAASSAGGGWLAFPPPTCGSPRRTSVRGAGCTWRKRVLDGRCYGGVSNIGCNPTFGENRLVAETHIFDFHDDIYGRPIKINLLRHLRGEQKFSGPEALAAQIRLDIEVARSVLAEAQKELLLSCEENFSR